MSSRAYVLVRHVHSKVLYVYSASTWVWVERTGNFEFIRSAGRPGALVALANFGNDQLKLDTDAEINSRPLDTTEYYRY